jgi:hypothetical protein
MDNELLTVDNSLLVIATNYKQMNKDILKKLVDYVVLNSFACNSTGLYNGKAGLSLCLFESSRYLKDEKIEEIAFDLIQEALLSKNSDVSFENGLSGIGYTLLYLLEQNYFEADFEELFSDFHQKIIDWVDTQPKEDALVNNMKMLYYLHKHNQIKPNKKQEHRINYWLYTVEERLIGDLEKLKDLHIKINIEILKKNLRSYFDLCNGIDKKVNIDICKRYKEAIRFRLTALSQDKENILINYFSLEQKIDYLSKYNFNKSSEYLNNLTTCKETLYKRNSNIEESILKSINTHQNKFGFKTGVGRLVLFESIIKNKEFNKLKFTNL